MKCPLLKKEKGRKTGIYQTWEEYKEQIQGYKNSIFKSFSTKEEAENFLSQNNNYRSVANPNARKKCHYIQRLSQNLSHTLMEVITMVHILMAA